MKMPIEIILQDQFGNYIEVVNWELGKKLVKFNFAQLLFVSPCTIKLSHRLKVLDELKSGVRPWKRTRRSDIYGNVLFRSHTGQDMFRNGTYKAFWYMAR